MTKDEEKQRNDVLILENQDTGKLIEFEAVNGEIHLPEGQYILRSSLPQVAMFPKETILI